jgi:hypothetical protein
MTLAKTAPHKWESKNNCRPIVGSEDYFHGAEMTRDVFLGGGGYDGEKRTAQVLTIHQNTPYFNISILSYLL